MKNPLMSPKCLSQRSRAKHSVLPMSLGKSPFMTLVMCQSACEWTLSHQSPSPSSQGLASQVPAPSSRQNPGDTQGLLGTLFLFHGHSITWPSWATGGQHGPPGRSTVSHVARRGRRWVALAGKAVDLLRFTSVEQPSLGPW